MVEAAWYDVTGEELDATSKLQASQALEMNHYDRLEVSDEAEIAEGRAQKRRGPSNTDGVYYEENTEYKPMWVDQQYKTDGVDKERAAGTPPRNKRRMLINRGHMTDMYTELHDETKTDTYIESACEAHDEKGDQAKRDEQEGRKCGTRLAAHNWQRRTREVMKEDILPHGEGHALHIGELHLQVAGVERTDREHI